MVKDIHVSNQCLWFERDLQNIIVILFLNYLEIFVDSIVLCYCTNLKNIWFFLIKWWSYTERASGMQLFLRSSSFQDFEIAFINWIQKQCCLLLKLNCILISNQAFAIRFSLKPCPIVDGILGDTDRLLLHFLIILWKMIDFFWIYV